MKIFKYGVEVFNSSQKQCGGFNHFIAGKIFRWKLSYLDIHLLWDFCFEIVHENENIYYDGYHNHIWIGFIMISYGTS